MTGGGSMGRTFLLEGLAGYVTTRPGHAGLESPANWQTRMSAPRGSPRLCVAFTQSVPFLVLFCSGPTAPRSGLPAGASGPGAAAPSASRPVAPLPVAPLPGS